MICPKCGRKFERLLAVSRTDNKTMICDNCGTMEALDSVPQGDLDTAGAHTACGGGNGE